MGDDVKLLRLSYTAASKNFLPLKGPAFPLSYDAEPPFPQHTPEELDGRPLPPQTSHAAKREPHDATRACGNTDHLGSLRIKNSESETTLKLRKRTATPAHKASAKGAASEKGAQKETETDFKLRKRTATPTNKASAKGAASEKGAQPTNPPKNRRGDRTSHPWGKPFSTRYHKALAKWEHALKRTTRALDLVRLIDSHRRKKANKWSTTETRLGTALGALKRLNGLDPCRPPYTGNHPDIREYAKVVIKKKLTEVPRTPLALTPATCLRAVRRLQREGRISAAVLLAISWITTARVRCATKLCTANTRASSMHFTARFTDGKGVNMRGQAYTIHTTMGPWARMIQDYTATRTDHTFLFQQPEKVLAQVREALHHFDRRLELRSPRRGALQTMSRQGTSTKVLMHFSGHASEKTLLRYLGWGWHLGAMATRGRKASLALFRENATSATPTL